MSGGAWCARSFGSEVWPLAVTRATQTSRTSKRTRRSDMGSDSQPRAGSSGQQRLHSGGDHFLGVGAVAVSDSERLFRETTFDELGKLGFIGGAEAVDKLRHRAAVVSHLECAVFKRFCCAARTK